LTFREGEQEGRSSTWLRFDPDAATVAIHDLLADRQTDSGSRKFSRMQALKGLEHTLLMGSRYPDPVVAND